MLPKPQNQFVCASDRRVIKMYLSVWLVAGALTCAYAYLWLRGRRARGLLKGLPSFYNLPFIGSAYKFIGGGEAVFKIIEECSEIIEEKDKPFLIWNGPFPYLIFSNEEEIKVIAEELMDKPYLYDFMKDWLGHGIFTAPASVWKHSSKNLAGTLIAPIIESYQPVFNKHAQRLVDGLKGEVGGEPFDVMHKYMALTTLEILCETSLGVNCISDNFDTTTYYAAFTRTAELIMRRELNPLMHPDPLFRLTSTYRELQKTLKYLHQVSQNVVNKKVLEWEQKKKIGGDQTQLASSSTGIKCFLDILLELRGVGGYLTPQQIKAEVDTIIFGGQDTPATATSFVMLMLGSHPDVQDKLYAEMKEIFGESKRPVTVQDLSQMKYCEAVIYETLRLYPPGMLIFRYADVDLKLKSCTIPEGSICTLNIWGSGRSRRTWGPDAADFRPERWLDEEYVRTHSSSFMAFSFGRRSCFGRKYAIVLIKTLLAYCVRELKFSSEAHKLRLAMELVLRAVDGHQITVERR